MNRKSIRKRVQQLLKDADIPNIGQDVFAQSATPDSIESLPVINVYTLNEDVDRENWGDKAYRRSLSLTIEIKSKHNTSEELADDLDDLSELAEKAIEQGVEKKAPGDSIFFKEHFENITLVSTRCTTEPDNQSPVGSCVLLYSFIYISEAAPAAIHKDLKTFGNTYSVNGNEDEEAKDQINFEE